MNEFDLPATELPVVNTAPETGPEQVLPETHPDPVRVAAGRAGARRLVELTEFGRQYEREHGLTPGRQRRRQLIQLGKRYELEHGLRVSRPRRRPQGDPWEDFLAALVRVVKPAYRPVVEKLVSGLRSAQPQQ